jgi:hypothetical protein
MANFGQPTKPMAFPESDEALLQELDAIRASLCNIQANSLNLAVRIVNIMDELKEKNDGRV